MRSGFITPHLLSRHCLLSFRCMANCKKLIFFLIKYLNRHNQQIFKHLGELRILHEVYYLNLRCTSLMKLLAFFDLEGSSH